MNDKRGATRRIAKFVAGTSIEDIPRNVRNRARLLILDTLGVSLAALDFPIGRITTSYVDTLGGQPTATVFGTDIRTSAPLAALANGTLAHALDYDDHGHLSTHVLPAAIAVGEQTSASGRTVLEAYVVGREVGARMSALLEAKRKQLEGPTYRGWYRVGVVGPLAAAAAACKVLGLGEGQTAQAIGIACSSSAGLRRNQGTMAKALHAGNAAESGVTAALLAMRGFTADVEAIEAPLGLVGALCLPGEADWAPLDHLGAPYALAERLAVKRFPACSPSHIPLAAALRIRNNYRIHPADVVAIEADLHQFSLMRPDPQEAIATGYSLPYLLAVALIDGNVGLDQVGEERLNDQQVRSLMAKVTHDSTAAPRVGPERVTVRLTDGTVIREEVAQKPDLSDDSEIVAKFEDCAGRRFSADGVQRLRDAIMTIESIRHIEDLTALTRSSAAGVPSSASRRRMAGTP